MKLSIVIVNYNVKYFLEQCLISVKRAITGIEAEVIVVDNASSDGSCDLVSAKFSWVKLLRSENNLGFSRGNNLGIESAKGQYILLLNPDTVVAEDAFEKCLAFMDAHNDAGALGVRMVDGKGNFLPESKRGLPTPAAAFYKTFGLSALFPKSKIFGKYHQGFLSEKATHEIEILSGAFMLIRKKVLDQIGLLDEAFFMYGEDIDLSYRIIKAGYKNYYFPETTIIHYKGESTRKTSVNYVKVFYKAMIIFSKKHFSGNQSGLFSFFINMAIIFRGGLSLLANLFSSSYLFIIDALLSFSGIYFITTYWENAIKYAEHYYPNQFLFIVVPVYIIIWIVAAFLGGGYDKPYRTSNILRGVFFGTLAIAAVYAFLPNEWRFSRAIIILGAMWTAFEMLLTRLTYHLIKYQTLSIENEEEKRILLVGNGNECSRAEKLLISNGAKGEVVNFIYDMKELKKLSRVYAINEIIFCSSHLPFKQIIDNIILLGGKMDYKILNEGSAAFVGSNSKNTAGDLYSFDHHFNLAVPAYQRRKRMVDILTCMVFIPLFPINVFIIKKPIKFAMNWVQVLRGKKTWIGYAKEAGTLPYLENGVISGAEEFAGMNLDELTISKLNWLYAKHYSAGNDLKLLFNNYRKLGK